MDIQPIKSAADYEAAVAEIDRLMDARTGTPDGDRLDALSTLVDAYEEVEFRIDQSS